MGQMKLGLGLKKEVSLLRSDYMSCLKHATNTGDLKPFGKVILSSARSVKVFKDLGRE